MLQQVIFLEELIDVYTISQVVSMFDIEKNNHQRLSQIWVTVTLRKFGLWSGKFSAW